jgi:hypothetical protein
MATLERGQRATTAFLLARRDAIERVARELLSTGD